MLSDILAVLFGLLVIGLAIKGIVRGRVSFTMLEFFDGTASRRDEDPLPYWIVILAWMAVGGFLFLFGVNELSDRVSGEDMTLPPQARQMQKEFRSKHVMESAGSDAPNDQH